MRSHRSTFSLSLLAGLLLPAICGGHGEIVSAGRVSGPVGEAIDTYLGRLVPFGFWGAALVAIDGEVALHRGYGWADEAEGVPNTGDTVFGLQSVSKQFTAAAVMTLVEDGRLSTGDRMAEYVEGVPEDKQAITIHHLLTHTSGLIAGTETYIADGSRSGVLSAALEAPLRHAPGEMYSYSNIGYAVLAMIVENVTGHDFESYLREAVFEPAGLEFTGYRAPDWARRTVAHSYAEGRDNGTPLSRPYPDWNYIGGGGLLSTAGDLYRWEQALATDKVLGPAAKEQMYTPDQNGYAYGWRVEETKRGKEIRHNGGESDGRASSFRRYLDAGVTLIVFSNRDGEEMLFGNGVVNHIEDMLFGEEVPLPPEVPPAVTTQLDPYVGMYRSPAGSVQVNVEGSRLVVRGWGQGVVEAVLGLRDSGSFSHADSVAREALHAMSRGDTTVFRSILANPSTNRVPVWIRQRVEKGAERLGPFQRYTVLGTTPDWISGFGTMMTFARAEFEGGTLIFRLHWGEDGVRALGGSSLAAPVSMPFLPLGDAGFAGYHVATGRASDLRFWPPREDGSTRLILGNGGGGLTLVR